MISLNGVTLSPDLLWEGEFDDPSVSQNIERTVLGNVVVTHMPLTNGRVIDLRAISEGGVYYGSFSRTQIIAFKVLEQEQTEVTFHYEGTDYQVMVQAGGVQVSPLLPRPNQASDDLYIGTLILVEV